MALVKIKLIHKKDLEQHILLTYYKSYLLSLNFPIQENEMTFYLLVTFYVLYNILSSFISMYMLFFHVDLTHTCIYSWLFCFPFFSWLL